MACKEKIEQPRKEGRRNSRQHATGLSAAREREELLRGAEVLQNTQRWFQSRLAFLSAEQKQRTAEKVCYSNRMYVADGVAAAGS